MKRTSIILALILMGVYSHAAPVKARLYYAWVDKVNVRVKPEIKAKVIYQLKQGEDVTYTRKKTKKKTTVTLQGKKYTKAWAQVVTRTGKTGWVHAATLQKKTTLVCWLNSVKVRDVPDLKAKKVATLNEKEEVEYLGYATDTRTKVTLRGKTYNEPFYKVKMKNGKVVWVYGATVKNVVRTPSDTAHKTVVVKPGELQEAIINHTPGMIIQLTAGKYKNKVAINIRNKQDLTIIGNKNGGSQIICTSQYDDVLLISDSSGITLQNLTLKHEIPVTESCSGMVITINDSKNITFENSDINGCGWIGINSYNNAGITVNNSYFHDNYEYAMNFSSKDRDIIVQGCRIDNNGGGIVIDWGGTEILADESPQDWLILRNNEWGFNHVRDDSETGGYQEEDYNEYEGEEYEGRR